MKTPENFLNLHDGDRTITQSGTHPVASVGRRDALKLAVSVLAAALPAPSVHAQTSRSKKVIIGGGGIAGLCCGYELMKRGHEVTVLEAAARAPSSAR